MEICIDSVQSAKNAEVGGASRVELCANLVEGGTTPTIGMLRVVKKTVGIPVFVMIRPRGGDFVYSEEEFQVMIEDVRELKANHADGFVFGILTPEGDIDKDRCKELAGLCKPLPITFHRAFDMVKNPYVSMETLISLGFDRVLTSGQDSTALEGLPLIQKLVEQAKGRIIIVPGGNITVRNLERILKGSGTVEFHCSSRSTRESVATYRNHSVTMGASFGPPEFSIKVADRDKVNSMMTIAKSIC